MPVSGAWRLSYSMYSRSNSGKTNIAWLYINGQLLDESEHRTNSERVNLEASAGDEIEIRTSGMEVDYYDIQYCAEYIPKM